MELIIEAFDLLRAIGMTNTQDGFSRMWLRQSAGYFAYLKSARAKPSLESLACLGQTLMELSATLARLAPLTDLQRTLRQRVFDLGMRLSVNVISEAIKRGKTQRVV